jgi:hypothetical protein
VLVYRLPDVERSQVISELKGYVLDLLQGKIKHLSNKIEKLNTIN